MGSVGLCRRTGRVLRDFDHVVQSVEVIFSTRLGSRVMLRWFGAGLVELLGRRITPRLVSLYCTLLALGITVWEPRLQVVSVDTTGNTIDAVRLGDLNFEVQVYYRPNGHKGDFTVEGGLRAILISANDNRVVVSAAA